VTEYASLEALARWILRQDGRAVPQSPPDLRRTVKSALKAVQDRHEGEPPKLAREVPRDELEPPERPGSPVAPERFGLLQALLAYLLDACGEGTEAEIPAQELVERFRIPKESLEEHLSLLNLVNFGGGCYAVYAELRGDRVHVDKELFGDTFRAPPRLTPLEARAIRLALEFVGPMIAADAHTPLERVRRKLEETFGEFALAQTPEPDVPPGEEDLVSTFSDAIRDARLVEIEYMKEGEKQPTTRVVEPYQLERELPHWYLHAFDPKNEASRSFRLDRIRSAKKLRGRFERRPEFDPQRFAGTQTVRIWYSPQVARWEIERGAMPLADGSAVKELQAGDDWLIGEILSFRGEAAVLEPAGLRKRVATRAKELARELGVSRVAAAARS
jgi:predicted DNA-binding transcriptional regulator YafY